MIGRRVRRWHDRRHNLATQYVPNPNLQSVLHIVVTCSCGKAWVR